MDVEIGTLSGKINVNDGGPPVSRELAETIAAMVLAILDDRNRNTKQARSDTRVTSGVAAEQEHGE